MNKYIISEIRKLKDKYQARIDEINQSSEPEAYSKYEPDVLEEVIEDLKQLIKSEVDRCL